MIFPTRIPPGAPPAFVLDVSVAAAWGIPPRYSVYAHRVRFRLVTGTPALVATNWPLDLADELHTAVGRGETTRQRVDGALAVLSTYQLYLDDQGPSRAWPQVLNLARAHSLPVREAAQLDLALRHNLPLATADATLLRVATVAGVSVFTP
jgi:predicted nucleic acid-binding protein